ncbi:hypothetical protein RB200_19860 [Streptomyces sp. PmtG]
MNILIAVLLLVLIALGFNEPVLWLAAAVIVYFLIRSRDRGPVRTGSSGTGTGAGGSGPGGSSGSGSGGTPSSYRDYRIRRARQERWDRRYRRTHPNSPTRRA